MSGMTKSPNPLSIINGTGDDDKVPSIDIIAVHGLNGESYRPWISGPVASQNGSQDESQDESTGLLDELGSLVDRACVMTFAHKLSTWDRNGILSEDTIEQTARDLLHSLAEKREKYQSQNVPIAFIGHSFGGIIVKKALVMAKTNNDWIDIAESCNKLIFFSTPHRSSNSLSWEDLLQNILVASHRTTSQPFVNIYDKQLNCLSRFIEGLSNQFISIPTHRCFVNIYEQTGHVGQAHPVVDSYSAITGHVHEINIAHPSEHNDICNIRNNDTTVSIILGTLKAETNAQYRTCLSDLFKISPPFIDPEVELQLSALESWDTIELPDQYRAWLGSTTHPIITACGPQRSSKGLWPRALFHKAQEKPGTAAYFSFASHDFCRSSVRALLGSVVFQLFTRSYETYKGVEELYTTIKDVGAWTEGGLLTLFQAILDLRKDDDPVYLIVDGDYGCDSSWEKLVDVLLAVLSSEHSRTKLKVALFYGSHPENSNPMGKLDPFHIQIPLSAEQSLRAPLDAIASRIIQENCYLTRKDSRVSVALRQCQDISALLLTAQSFDDMPPPRTPKSVIETLGKDISEVVSKRYKSLQNWARLALGWVAFAKRPLTLDELVTAVALTKRNNNVNTSFDPRDIPLNTVAEVNFAFGHLLRVEYGSIFFSTDRIRDYFLQLIAEENRRRSKQIAPADSRSNGQPHGGISETEIPEDTQITRVLTEYLSMPDVIDSTDLSRGDSHIRGHEPLFNLARYAIQFWPNHYQSATNLSRGNIDLPDLTRSGQFFQSWSKLYARIELTALPPNIYIANLLILTALLGITGIFSNLKGPDTETSHRNDAIKIASWSGHENIVAILLRDAGEVDFRSLVIALEYASTRRHIKIVKQLLLHIWTTYSLSPDKQKALGRLASQLRYKELFDMFDFKHMDGPITRVINIVTDDDEAIRRINIELRQPNIESDVKLIDKGHGPKGITPIMLACMKKRSKIVEFLLSQGANPTLFDSDNYTALYHSLYEGKSRLAEIVLRSVESVTAFKDFVKAFLRAVALKISETFRHYLDSSVRYMDKALEDISDEHAFHYAITWKLLDVVPYFHNNETDPNLENSDRKTPLELAAMHGVIETMKYLVRTRHVKVEKEATIVFQVIRSSKPLDEHAEAVNLLIEAGADLNMQSRTGKSALHVAVRRNRTEIVKVLLMKGANVNLKCNRGWNALHYAANYATISEEICRALIKVDAGIATSPDIDSWLPVHLAARSGNIQLLEVLYELNRDCLKERDQNRRTPLHFAYNTPKALRWLLGHGVDVNATDLSGETPLMNAFHSGSEESILILMKACDADLTIRDISGRTVLHHAANAGAIGLGRELLRSNGNIVSFNDAFDLSALHFAIRSGQSAFAEMLLNDFYSKNTHNSLNDLVLSRVKAKSDGESPLISAVKRGQYQVVKKLLELGAEKESRDENGRTALLAAVDTRDELMIEILLDRKTGKYVDVDAGDNYPTALHEAAKSGDLALVKRLVSLGASVNALGGKYKTALNAAAFAGFDKVIQFLLENGAEAPRHAGSDIPGVLRAALNVQRPKKLGQYGKAGVAWFSPRQAAAAH
ncbi:ankyrin repeat-containing domain protein [Camillea tinctor]|nr:ankyrin repeat-containing domain protein [Camillea tinctor]